MKLTFLGTSHGAPEKNRHCTSVLIEHRGNHYLIDLGAPVVYLFKQMELSVDTLRGVFITHMHADHTAEFTALVKSFSVYHPTAEADVFMPEEQAVEPLKGWIRALHIDYPDRLHTHITHPGVIYEADGLRVTAIRTEHISPDVPSYAFVFEADGKRVLFTGDLAYDYHDYPVQAKNEAFDVVVSELVHLSIDKAQSILEGTNTRLMIFSHIGLENIAQMEKRDISFAFPHIIACDGFSYYVPKSK